MSNSPNLDNFTPDQNNVTYTLENIPSSDVSSHFKSTGGNPAQWGHATYPYNYSEKISVDTNVCVLEFEIPNDIGPPVLFYYRLTNFYQNHRRYVKSMDTSQLEGNARSASDISGSDCDPLTTDSETKKPLYPCGLIANSLFNDTFELPFLTNPPDGTNSTYAMSNKNIAWSSDKDIYKTSKYTNEEVMPPPNWRVRFPQYDDDTPIPNIQEWEEFQVWMRTAGLPTFSKLALRNDNDVMKAGRYRLAVWDGEHTFVHVVKNS